MYKAVEAVNERGGFEFALYSCTRAPRSRSAERSLSPATGGEGWGMQDRFSLFPCPGEAGKGITFAFSLFPRVAQRVACA